MFSATLILNITLKAWIAPYYYLSLSGSKYSQPVEMLQLVIKTAFASLLMSKVHLHNIHCSSVCWTSRDYVFPFTIFSTLIQWLAKFFFTIALFIIILFFFFNLKNILHCMLKYSFKLKQSVPMLNSLSSNHLCIQIFMRKFYEKLLKGLSYMHNNMIY